jgi:hypothetical protein
LWARTYERGRVDRCEIRWNRSNFTNGHHRLIRHKFEDTTGLIVRLQVYAHNGMSLTNDADFMQKTVRSDPGGEHAIPDSM